MEIKLHPDCNRGKVRLRFSLEGIRYELTTGVDYTDINGAKIKKLVSVINEDIEHGTFDYTLSRYKEVRYKFLSKKELSVLFKDWVTNIIKQDYVNNPNYYGVASGKFSGKNGIQLAFIVFFILLSV